LLSGSAVLLDKLHEMAHTPSSVSYVGRFGHITNGKLPLVGERFGTVNGTKSSIVSPKAATSPLAASSSSSSMSSKVDPSTLALGGRVPVTSVPTAGHASAAAHAIIEEHFSDCDVAWCSGSLVRGQGTATSDLDIVILYLAPPTRPYFRGMNNGTPPVLPYRASFQTAPSESSPESGWPVEVFVHTPESLRYWFDKDRLSRKPSLCTMVTEGTIVWRSSDTTMNTKPGITAEMVERNIATAISDAKALIAAGPPPLTSSELVWARYNVTSLMDDVRGDITATGGEFAFASAALAQSIAELWLGYHRRWQGSGKWVYRTLRAADPILARQLATGLTACFTINNQAQLLDVAARVLSITGGAAFDGLYSDSNGARMLSPTLSIDDGTGSNNNLGSPLGDIGATETKNLSTGGGDDAIVHSPPASRSATPALVPPPLVIPPPIGISTAPPSPAIVDSAPPTPTPTVTPPTLSRAPSSESTSTSTTTSVATAPTPTTTATIHGPAVAVATVIAPVQVPKPMPPAAPAKLAFTSQATAIFADRIAGCIFGAAIGDAIGVATEFMDRDEANFHYRPPLQYGDIVQDRHRIKFRRGHWTDDTYQGLVIMLSML
jgi:predicted nucleotidyltransferase